MADNYFMLPPSPLAMSDNNVVAKDPTPLTSKLDSTITPRTPCVYHVLTP